MAAKLFEKYADAYDILYKDKDYDAECTFMENIFSRFANKPIRSILDLGCGTGRHALPLSQRGYVVTGIDRSEKMLAYARKKAAGIEDRLTFKKGDIRTLELGAKFDAVISMFAVMSYQTTNDDLSMAIQAVSRHLEPGGLFVFDAWHGPAVLTEGPSEKVRDIVEQGVRTIRITSPRVDISANTVDVNFKVLTMKNARIISEVEEVHTMRFLFQKEIEFYLNQSDLVPVKFCPFMALDKELTSHDWNMTAIAKKR